MSIKKTNFPPSVTQFYGVFKLKDLLGLIRGFLADAGYDVIETKYKQKFKEGSEVEAEYECELKYNHYTKFKINVSVKIEDMKDVEVEKVKAQQGRVQVTLTGEIELDYDERFEKNKFLEFLRGFYHKFILHETIENVYWDTVHSTMFRLQRAIRDQFQFEAR